MHAGRTSARTSSHQEAGPRLHQPETWGPAHMQATLSVFVPFVGLRYTSFDMLIAKQSSCARRAVAVPVARCIGVHLLLCRSRRSGSSGSGETRKGAIEQKKVLKRQVEIMCQQKSMQHEEMKPGESKLESE
jgi:hypothetical protein